LNRVSAAYVSGANPLTEGQPTRVTFTYEIRNLLNVPLDFNGTVTFEMGSSVSVVSAIPTRGSATVAPQRVTWDGFVLNPGESASITVTADVTPPPGSAGRAVVVVEGVLVTARTPAGGLVEVRGGALTSDLINGLANGGLVAARAVLAPVAPGVPAPVAPGAVGTVPVAPAAAAVASRPAVGGPTAPALPRTGTGLLATDTEGQTVVPLLAVLSGLAVAGTGALWVRRRTGRAPAP
jgi:hypothetical protein